MAVSIQTIIIISWPLTGVTILLTLGRFYLRYKTLGGFRSDDLSHLISVILFIAAVVIFQISQEVNEQFIAWSEDKSLEPPDLPTYMRWNISITMLSLTSFWVVKVTFLLFYWMLFKISPGFRKAWWITTVFTAITYAIVMSTTLLQCEGASKNLDDYSACSSSYSVTFQHRRFVANAILNVATDFAIMGIAIGMLRNLSMKRKQKLGLALIFALTLAVIAIELLRMGQSVGGTGHNINVLWLDLELAVGCIVAALPAYNVLLIKKSVNSGYKVSRRPSELPSSEQATLRKVNSSAFGGTVDSQTDATSERKLSHV